MILLDDTNISIVGGFFAAIWDLICKLWWLLWHNPLAFLGVFGIFFLIHIVTRDDGSIHRLPW